MKILQINASYKPAFIYGGPTMSVSKLSELLVGAGILVEVLTTTANGANELDVTPGATVMVEGVPITYFKRLTKDHTHFSPALLKCLWKEIKQYDVVHIHAWWNLVSVLSCWIAVKRGVPVVISPRGTLSAYSFRNRNGIPKRLIHVILGKYLLERSWFHVTSKREKQAVEEIISHKRIINIFNFVNFPKKMTAKPETNDKILKLLFFSRIEEKKGLDILFKALAMVQVPYHLTVAGDGAPIYLDSLKQLAKNTGLSGVVDWIGFQGPNKFEIMQKHDLMVLPSHDENFGNVVIECLSVGTPVLVSRNVGLADYVTGNCLGWVCELNENDISAHINIIFDQKNKLMEIRKTAPDIIRNDFDEKNLTEKYISMYNQIINNG
ncbi:XrtY-associated glycosyltransferase XYAG1 [Mucilaginibacter sp. BT774]|uniref:XrtY-associated glycosyltransferase XYAG1 n=1 Tax=Mucilaginibacter sp. BT774 TaxID=3062276 RepID=UPI002676F826|nr:glycosyltransferase [Mucilaginibacter sp. BT774]MDO3627485.1 glycosyltransferase [Mucilaginibacter sp. BT774]